MSGFDAEFTIMDFLDDRGRMDSPFKDWVLSYLDEVPDGSEDYDAHIVGVTDCGRYCTLRIEAHVKESQHSYTDMDGYYWCARMSGWHGVSVIPTVNSPQPCSNVMRPGSSSMTESR